MRSCILLHKSYAFKPTQSFPCRSGERFVETDLQDSKTREHYTKSYCFHRKELGQGSRRAHNIGNTDDKECRLQEQEIESSSLDILDVACSSSNPDGSSANSCRYVTNAAVSSVGQCWQTSHRLLNNNGQSPRPTVMKYSPPARTIVSTQNLAQNNLRNRR